MTARNEVWLVCLWFLVNGLFFAWRARKLGLEGEAWNKVKRRPMTKEEVRRVKLFLWVVVVVSWMGAAVLVGALVWNSVRFGEPLL